MATVFLRVDHSDTADSMPADYEPMIWETMLCTGDEVTQRWCWCESDSPLERHQQLIEAIKQAEAAEVSIDDLEFAEDRRYSEFQLPADVDYSVFNLE